MRRSLKGITHDFVRGFFIAAMVAYDVSLAQFQRAHYRNLQRQCRAFYQKHDAYIRQLTELHGYTVAHAGFDFFVEIDSEERISGSGFALHGFGDIGDLLSSSCKKEERFILV